MQAALLETVDSPIVIQDIPTPRAGAGQVVVQLKAAALNHRDVWIQKGRYPGMKLPVVLGSDGAGVVVEVGEGVDAQWLGKAVIINAGHNWGADERFYGPDFKILGMPDNGTFAEFIGVEAQYLAAKPAHLSFEEAAAVPLAGLTGWRALTTRAALQPGERVLVTGTGGGVALFVLQFAVAMGAEVWITSGSDEKIAKAVALGAKGGVNYKNADWAKALIAATGGNRTGYFDVIIDSAGGAGFAKLIDVATAGGRICFFGGTTGNITDVVPNKVFFKQLNIFGSTMGSQKEFVEMVQFVETHQIKPVLDEIFPLSDAEAALRRMDTGAQFGKIVLKIST
ncbi:MAG: alcohol dehydrogenase [Cytophagia bacterium]|nr:MAG: alcohol dehydrogenase [Runella sp.]TAG19078.1 MAG: alcohol dehydrogenase [Cytophagales bacterium]TAG38368.1 MAG: alcohol dehydrogenase [Cytophagia bacterium]TAG75481.1 MAG: alcohol dehydrogenase [Runella slithyformis]TAG79934.1 MAG: alcohol dehydrogenase [Cytophagales bacterium]